MLVVVRFSQRRQSLTAQPKPKQPDKVFIGTTDLLTGAMHIEETAHRLPLYDVGDCVDAVLPERRTLTVAEVMVHKKAQHNIIVTEIEYTSLNGVKFTEEQVTTLIRKAGA